MSRVQWIALAGLLLLALLIVRVGMGARKPPFLPVDRDHSPAMPTAQCLHCHGPGGSSPRPSDHPIGNDCGRCHRVRP